MKTNCRITITNSENAVLKTFEQNYNHGLKASLNYSLKSAENHLKTQVPRLTDDDINRCRYRQRISRPNSYDQTIILTIDLRELSD